MDWNLIFTIIGVIIAALVIPQWWSSEVTRVRAAVREAKPDVYFHVGGYRGAGQGYTVDIQNRGPAFSRGAVYLPGVDGALQIDEIPLGFGRVFQVPLRPDAPPLTTRLPDAEARFVYRDRLGLEYGQSLALLQQARNDGGFNVGTAVNPRHTSPLLGWREIWRLRKEV
jgi:hypothetical protein